MSFDTKRIVDSWHSRALAYNELIARWPLFTQMADQLIDVLPDDFSGQLLDLGGGSGLLSERLLLRHPKTLVTLIEPSNNMLELAKQRLRNTANFINATAEQLQDLHLKVDAVLCNAAFHLMDEELVLPAIARALNSGGLCAFNLWGHSFDETANRENIVDWLSFVERATQEQGETLATHSPGIAPRTRSIQELKHCAIDSGLELDNYRISEHRTHARFGIEFAAMSDNFLGQFETQKRSEIIKRAIELSSGYDLRMSVDFVFRKQ